MTNPDLGRIVKDGKVPPLVYLYGEETFLLEAALRSIVELLVPADVRDFNLEVRLGKDVGAQDILESASTLPVLNPCRLIVVKDAQGLASSELDRLLAYLRQPVPETVLVFAADKIDGRKKFFQEFRKFGVLVEYRRPAENQLPGLVTEMARTAGRSLTSDALALFCQRVGCDLGEAHTELAKLFAYLGEERRLADVADVEAVVSAARNENIFHLANAIGRRNLAESFRLLHRLLDEGAAPLLLLSLLVKHFRQLWKIRDLLDRGTPKRDLPGLVGVSPYFMDGLIDQARRVEIRCFPFAFDLLLQTDLALKSSGAHPSALLEKLLLDLRGLMEDPKTSKGTRPGPF